MLVYPRDPRCFLLTEDELSGQLPAPARPYRRHLRTVADWAHDYLTSPHPELGRSGPVCPYAGASLKKRLFYLTVQAAGPRSLDQSAVADAVARYRDWFADLAPTEEPARQFKTILILFPEVPAADAPHVIDATQAALKPSFVDTGLMIGQFHPLPPADGPAQPGPLVEGGAEVVDRNPRRGASLGQRGVRLEGLRDERLAQINPRTQPVERPGQRIERPLVSRKRHRVADQSVLARRQPGRQ